MGEVWHLNWAPSKMLKSQWQLSFFSLFFSFYLFEQLRSFLSVLLVSIWIILCKCKISEDFYETYPFSLFSSLYVTLSHLIFLFLPFSRTLSPRICRNSSKSGDVSLLSSISSSVNCSSRTYTTPTFSSLLMNTWRWDELFYHALLVCSFCHTVTLFYYSVYVLHNNVRFKTSLGRLFLCMYTIFTLSHCNTFMLTVSTFFTT